MFTNTFSWRAACVLLLVGVAGCSSALKGMPPIVAACSTPTAGDRPGPALVGQTYGMQMTALPLNSVQFDSTDTARKVAVQALFASRTPVETVQVSARLLHCGDGIGSVRVRTSFLRRDTSPSEPASAWKTVYLTPRATAVYQETSVSKDVTNYLIEIGAGAR
jgi:hypothetical protein